MALQSFSQGTLILIEKRLYLELHNFSFARTQQSNSISKSTKEMPWSTSSTSPSSSSSSPHIPITKSIIHQKIQEQIAPILGKRSIVAKFQPNKLNKLSDIASSALTLAESSVETPNESNQSNQSAEEIQEQEEVPVSIITPELKKRKPRVKKV